MAALAPTVSRGSHGDDTQPTTGLPSDVVKPESDEKIEEKNFSDTSPTDSVSEARPPPEFKEGGYGWVVVLAVWLVNAHTWGINASYSIFLAYYLRTGVFEGGTPLTFSFVAGLSVSIALLCSPLATVCIRLFGTVTTFRIGLVFETVSFIGASFTSKIWHLLLSQGVCFGLGLGFCFTATVGVVPQWFTKRRSFANAVATSGSGFGGLTYALATNTMINNLGLPWAFRILAIITFVVNGVSSLLLRDRNKAIGAVHVAFHKDLFKRVEVWLYMIWGFFAMMGYIIVIFSLTDYAQQVGFTPDQGSIVAAMFNLSQGIGRPMIGLFSDRIGRINIAGLSTLIAGLAALVIWIPGGKSYGGLIVYALFGVFAGALWPTVAPVGAEVVGIQLLPAVLSIYWLFLVPSATVSEAIGLSLKTVGVNGYLHTQIFAGVIFLAGFVFIWLLRSWKIQEVESAASRADGEQVVGAQRKGIALFYISNMFKLRRV